MRVNGELLEPDQPHELTQGDKVVFGRTYIFRVYLNSNERVASEGQTLTPRDKRNQYDSSANIMKAIRELLSPSDFQDQGKVRSPQISDVQ